MGCLVAQHCVCMCVFCSQFAKFFERRQDSVKNKAVLANLLNNQNFSEYKAFTLLCVCKRCGSLIWLMYKSSSDDYETYTSIFCWKTMITCWNSSSSSSTRKRRHCLVSCVFQPVPCFSSFSPTGSDSMNGRPRQTKTTYNIVR